MTDLGVQIYTAARVGPGDILVVALDAAAGPEAERQYVEALRELKAEIGLRSVLMVGASVTVIEGSSNE